MENKRPAPIIAICLIWLFQIAYDVFLLTTVDLEVIKLIHVVVSEMGYLISLGGIWMMRKWGPMLFAVIFAANQFISILEGIWGFDSILLPTLIVAVSFAHYKRMR